MKNLKSILQNLIKDFSSECSISNRFSGGFCVCFRHVIPASCLSKLIDFCYFYKFTFNISVSIDGNLLEFNIYK